MCLPIVAQVTIRYLCRNIVPRRIEQRAANTVPEVRLWRVITLTGTSTSATPCSGYPTFSDELIHPRTRFCLPAWNRDGRCPEAETRRLWEEVCRGIFSYIYTLQLNSNHGKRLQSFLTSMPISFQQRISQAWLHNKYSILQSRRRSFRKYIITPWTAC
jgi:hypothetical protein